MRALIFAAAICLCACRQGPVDDSVANSSDSSITVEQVPDNENQISTDQIAPGENFTDDELQAIATESFLDSECRGGTSDTGNACDARDQGMHVLKEHGICFGKQGQVDAEYQYHHCTKDSI